MIKIKTVSSLEKCFLDSDPDDFEQIDSISVLKNQRFSFQIIARPLGDDRLMHRLYAKFTASGCLAPFVSARTVDFIPSVFPCYPDNYDDNYLSTSPGLYPDLLLPAKDDTLSIIGGQTRALWLTAQLDGSIAGDRTLDFTLSAGDNVLFSGAIKVHIIDAELPPQTLINTQWFHSDCLSTYYDAPVFSDRWWTIVRNFVDVAVKNGQNMLLTPVFTPPLDTAVGGERPTVQLIDVYFDGKNYTFSYDNLDKWLNMANSAGIKYYEISHLFTQWGAACAPKIIAHTPEGTKRIFGWDTQASDEEYKTFLRRFIPDFLTHMKARGDDKRCFFHISDEPGADSLAVYMKSKKCIADLLDGYPVMDALSNIEFYKQGVIDRPVAAINHIQPFIDEKVPDLWGLLLLRTVPRREQQIFRNALLAHALHRLSAVQKRHSRLFALGIQFLLFLVFARVCRPVPRQFGQLFYSVGGLLLRLPRSRRHRLRIAASRSLLRRPAGLESMPAFGRSHRKKRR